MDNTIIIESGDIIDVLINNSNIIIEPELHDIVIENVTERGFVGPSGQPGQQGPQGIPGIQGIPGTGINQINAGPVLPNNSLVLDSLDINIYSSCQWIVTVVDSSSNLYRSGVINATIDSWCHYAIIGDQVQYRLTVANLTLSITNNHPNQVFISVIRLPTAKP